MGKIVPTKKSCKYLGVHLDGSLRFNHHIDYVVKKLNKFCGLIYRIRYLYDKKCLMMFYNSFAKSVICYGLLIYGTGAKNNLKKIEMAQRRILRAIFFKKKYDSLENILGQNKIFTVFELYLVELVKELFRQLQSQSPTNFLPEMNSIAVKKHVTRSKMKGFLPIIRGRTLMKRKCLQNALCKSYNWLTQLNLLPTNIHSLTKLQTRSLINKLSTLYIFENKQLLTLFFDSFGSSN